MTKVYEIEFKGEITNVRFKSAPKLIDFFDAVDDIAKTGLIRLRPWDLSCGINLTNDEIYQLAEYVKSKFDKPSKVAIIAPADLSLGLARAYEVYREDDTIKQNVFRSEQGARVWQKISDNA